MLNNIIISTKVDLDSAIQLLPDGSVIWGDKRTTLLRAGDCIDGNGIVISDRKETDFIGNPEAINHIHMLPEVTIAGEGTEKRREAKAYKTYMEKLCKEIDKNDNDIEFIKEKLWVKTRKEATKYRKRLNSLESENSELKIDFDIFVHFGTQDEWQLFRSEVNADLKPLMQDIAKLKGELL